RVDRVHIEDANAGKLIAISVTVEVPSQLIPTTYRKHNEATLGGVLERLPLHGPKVVRDAALLAILSPADERHVIGGRVERCANVQIGYLELDAAGLAAAAQADDIASVAVDVHELRVEMSEPQPH